MLKIHDPALDIRLMRLAHLLLTECSVSRTAARLGQSQPSVSLALKRLRQIVGDPLLVRSGARLVPTERGLDFRQALEHILNEIDRVLEPVEPFDPAQLRRPVRIVAENCFGTFLMPRIIELIREQAPSVGLDFSKTPEEADLPQAIENGDVDLVVGNWPMPSERLRYAPLFDSEIACMVRPGHPLARRPALSMEEYLEYDHLSPTPFANFDISPIDGRLVQLGLHRRIAVTVPEYTIVPYVLARTDLVFTTGRPFAEHLASMMPFAVIPAPKEFGPMHCYMLWHDRAHNSSVGRWLRSVVRQAAAEIDAITPRAAEAAGGPAITAVQ